MRYEVNSIDAWGNIVEGFETNDLRHEGWVMIRGDWEDEQIIKALIAGDMLNKQALEAFRAGELQVESDHGDGLEVSESEQAWQNLEEESYVDANLDATPAQVAEAEDDGYGYTAENYELVTGMRPILSLQPEFLEGINTDWKSFWAKKVETYGETKAGGLMATLELLVNPEKLVSKSSSGPGKGAQFRVAVVVDGEFFGLYNFPDDFDDDDTVLGLGKGGVVVNDPELVQEQKVALDAFLERGGEAAPEFIAGEKDARRLFKAIRDNVDEYHDGKKTYEAFSTKQRELWDKTNELGCGDRVRELLRGTGLHVGYG